jgi:hypothetical protein
MSHLHITTDGDTLWLKCFADDPDAEDGPIVCMVEPGDEWDVMAAQVASHQDGHGCGSKPPVLPGWDEMTDLDKGAALMHLHKREWEGEEYAESDYPCRYFDHPALVALSPLGASRHAAGLYDEADALTARDPQEHGRLYDAALAADDARRKAEREAAK